MKDDLAYAERQLRYFTRLVDKLRLTSDASDAKEDEKGKEKVSPHPSKEKRAKEEETLSLSRARARFVPPSPEEVAAFCRERHNNVDPVLWWNFYQAKGWKIGNNKMGDWRSAVITWERDRDPSDSKTAAFEREAAEVQARRRNDAALAERLLAQTKALAEGGAS